MGEAIVFQIDLLQVERFLDYYGYPPLTESEQVALPEAFWDVVDDEIIGEAIRSLRGDDWNAEFSAP